MRSASAKSWETNWICWGRCCCHVSCYKCGISWETRECGSLRDEIRSSESTSEGICSWITNSWIASLSLITRRWIASVSLITTSWIASFSQITRRWIASVSLITTSRWIASFSLISWNLSINRGTLCLSLSSSVLGTWSKISSSNTIKHLLNCINCVFHIWKSICIHSLCCILDELTWAVTPGCKILRNAEACCVYSSIGPLLNGVNQVSKSIIRSLLKLFVNKQVVYLFIERRLFESC